jgi:L-lactate dehydrogenase
LPTSRDPILIDVSMSITSMGYAKQQSDAGKTLPGPWLIDHEGNATSNPGALFADPKGALLPLGGLDAGHKGFGLGLLIEAMTGALAGHGRADRAEGWGATVFIQVLDPEAFGGLPAFKRQMDHLAPAASASGCRASAACSVIAKRLPTASRSIRRSCPRSSPGRKNTASHDRWHFS